MSSTIILNVRPGSSVSVREELRNSWGSAPCIWFPLWDEAQRRGIIPKLHAYDSALSSDHFDDLWGLFFNQRFSIYQRAALGLTFDRWYVKCSDYQRLSNDLELFFMDFPVDSNRVNHWPHIIELLRSEKVRKTPALGFWWTTVSENPMAVYGKRKRDWSPYVDLYTELDCIMGRENTIKHGKE